MTSYKPGHRSHVSNRRHKLMSYSIFNYQKKIDRWLKEYKRKQATNSLPPQPPGLDHDSSSSVSRVAP